MTDIVISGVGVVSDLGNSFTQLSQNLLAGVTAIRAVTEFPVADHPCRIASKITVPPAPTLLDAERYDGLFPGEQCTTFCAVQALADAGLWAERRQLRVGLVMGIGADLMLRWDEDRRRGGNLIARPLDDRGSIAECVKTLCELNGPCVTVAAACASGNHAMAHALSWLRRGWVDICLAGGCDLGVNPCSLASFGNLRALSRNNDSPRTAFRPFDRDRDGMVLGEGGAVFVLERGPDARSRGRAGYAEVASVGLTSDAHHLVIPDPSARQAGLAIQQAIRLADLKPQDVDYINAHATGTQAGDICEARALKCVFGDDAQPLISSTKSMTGHYLSAAASIEAAACLTAFAYDVIPPTINLVNPDPQCDLNHVANVALPARINVAMSNSFGFGGHNSTLILRRAG